MSERYSPPSHILLRYLHYREIDDGGEIPGPALARLEQVDSRFTIVQEKVAFLAGPNLVEGFRQGTPLSERIPYGEIGVSLTGYLLSLCRHGALIAADPGSPNRYTCRGLNVVTVVEGFLTEVRSVADSLDVIRDCSPVHKVVDEAISLLDQTIAPLRARGED